MEERIGTTHPPEMPGLIPSNSQWLLGQGAGVWFCIASTAKANQYQIKRFAPNGSLDCDRIFEIENNGSVFDINQPYQFTHVSHCAKCRIKQNHVVFVFNYKGE
jgi:Family of unknown function (DUF6695)